MAEERSLGVNKVKNDITGDTLISSPQNSAYSAGWDLIFNKHPQQSNESTELRKNKKHADVLVSSPLDEIDGNLLLEVLGETDAELQG